MADKNVRTCDWPDCDIVKDVRRFKITDETRTVTIDLCGGHETAPLSDILRSYSRRTVVTSRQKMRLAPTEPPAGDTSDPLVLRSKPRRGYRPAAKP